MSSLRRSAECYVHTNYFVRSVIARDMYMYGQPLLIDITLLSPH